MNWRISLIVCCVRLLKFPPPRLASTVMLSATLLELTFSLPRNLKILCHLPITVMYVFICFVILLSVDYASLIVISFQYLWGVLCRFLMSTVLTTSWLISLRMDLYVQFLYLFSLFLCLRVNFSYECWFLTGLIAFFRWVCWLKMGTPRMIWSSQLMTICWPRLVSSCIFFFGVKVCTGSSHEALHFCF